MHRLATHARGRLLDHFYQNAAGGALRGPPWHQNYTSVKIGPIVADVYSSPETQGFANARRCRLLLSLAVAAIPL